MLDAKLKFLIDYYGISKVQDWTAITPASILSRDGIADKTLNYLRVLLASHGFTLKDDRTPEFWKKNLPEVRIVDSITDSEWGQDRGVICPFLILVDSAEQEPFTFQGMRCDADQEYRPLVVHTERRSLGRHPDSLGDYTTDGAIGRCHVERKSLDDLRGTLLGWNANGGDSRRERFECELANMDRLAEALVIIEGSYPDFLAGARATATRQPQENAKILHRSVRSLMRRYRGVQWMFAGTRRLAEKFVFDWFRDWHEEQVANAKIESKRLKRLQAPVKQSQSQVVLPESVASLF